MKKVSLITFLIILTLNIFAQWSGTNELVVTNSLRQDHLADAVTDGENDSIMVSYGGYNFNSGIYVQKVSSNGTIAWNSASSPVPVCTIASYKNFVTALADGNGGAYIGWTDTRHDATNKFTEIYLQHISNSGAVLWATNGVRVTNGTSTYNNGVQLCTDGLGGVIVNWSSTSIEKKSLQTHAQRYNALGEAQWGANGVQVCTAPGFRYENAMTSDGSGGAIITFLDTRNDVHGLNYDSLTTKSLTNGDIYAQRLSQMGAHLWGNNGMPICTAVGNQYPVEAISDESGGAILAWDDYRNYNGIYENIGGFVQNVNSSGDAQWLTNGLAVSNAPGQQFVYKIVTDGSGGLVVAMNDFNNGQLLFQRITSEGYLAWSANGTIYAPSDVEIISISMVNDGNGNSVLAYLLNSYPRFVDAQKINANGELQWGGNGLRISNGENPFGARTILSNNGSVIIGWGAYETILSPTGLDVVAVKLLSSGVLDGSSSTSGYVSAANGNWNVGATWAGGIVPPAAADVTIRHHVIGNINTSCNSLKVETPGQLHVNTGINITILK